MPSHLPSLLLSLSHFPYLGLLNPGYPVLALQRLHTRRYTNAVIRQLKHNLLRESSEGFSALIIVLTDAEGKSPTSMWTHCEAVMGFFNLSPTRVLDVALDVFASSVEIQWRFWLDFFKCTPWGREAAWTGGKGKGRATEDVAQLNTEAIEPFVLKEKGNRLLAEVLGFKFAEYQVCGLIKLLYASYSQ
jgi:THO complex subunit 2